VVVVPPLIGLGDLLEHRRTVAQERGEV